MRSERRLHWTTKDYFDLEANSIEKHEYLDGEHYKTIATLREVLIVDQPERLVGHHRRIDGDRWSPPPSSSWPSASASPSRTSTTGSRTRCADRTDARHPAVIFG